MFNTFIKRSLIFNSRRLFTTLNNPNYHMQEFVELRSDVKSLPTKKMRESLLTCVVGDDDYNEDSTMKLLQERVQKLFGKERALFVPSGTMGNMVGLSLNAGRDDIIIQGDMSHVRLVELQSQGLFGFKQLFLENLADGTLNFENAEFTKLLSDETTKNRLKILALENTCNFKGGRALPLNYEVNIKKALLKNIPHLKFHLDGSRVLNSAVHHNVDPKDLVKEYDTVNVCLSKGLGAPVGSMVLCDDRRYEELRRLRKIMGGSMRQSGVLASCALVALEDWRERMKSDNEKARRIAKGLTNIPNVNVYPEHVDTNIIIIYVDKRFKSKLADVVNTLNSQYKVNIGLVRYTGELRIVTHHQVDEGRIDYAIEKIRKVLGEIIC